MNVIDRVLRESPITSWPSVFIGGGCCSRACEASVSRAVVPAGGLLRYSGMEASGISSGAAPSPRPRDPLLVCLGLQS